MRNAPVMPPKYEKTQAPARLTAARCRDRFFAEVLGCDRNEAVLLDVEPKDVVATRENIQRYAERCRVKVSAHLIDGKLYVTPKRERPDRRPTNLSYRSIVMRLRGDARPSSESNLRLSAQFAGILSSVFSGTIRFG